MTDRNNNFTPDGSEKDPGTETRAQRRERLEAEEKAEKLHAAEGEREAYYPVSIYCPVCGKDSTRILTLDDDCRMATYSCACGYHGSFDFDTDTNCKLGWKIDWAMRWM